MRVNNYGFLYAILTLLLSACSNTPTTAPPVNMPLKATIWYATHFYDPQNFQAQALDIQASLTLSESGFSVSGSDGCNRFVGAYQGTNSANGRLHFSRLSSTRMACINHQPQSQAFIKALGSTTEFELYGKILTLYQGQKPLLRFSAEKLQKQDHQVHYKCATAEITVSFKTQAVQLEWLGTQQVLPYVLSASGNKYMNDQLTFWTKGQQAYLIWDNQGQVCEQLK